MDGKLKAKGQRGPEGAPASAPRAEPAAPKPPRLPQTHCTAGAERNLGDVKDIFHVVYKNRYV